MGEESRQPNPGCTRRVTPRRTLAQVTATLNQGAGPPVIDSERMMQMLFLTLAFSAVAFLEMRHEVLALILALSALGVMLVAFAGVPVPAYY